MPKLTISLKVLNSILFSLQERPGITFWVFTYKSICVLPSPAPLLLAVLASDRCWETCCFLPLLILQWLFAEQRKPNHQEARPQIPAPLHITSLLIYQRYYHKNRKLFLEKQHKSYRKIYCLALKCIHWAVGQITMQEQKIIHSVNFPAMSLLHH